MRALLLGLSCCCLVGSAACSNDSGDAGPGIVDSPSAAGTAGATASGGTGAGSGGAGGSAGNTTPAGGAPGTTPESIDVDSPLDTGNAGSTSSPNAPASPAPDAGTPPVASAVCPAGPFPDSPLPADAAPDTVCSGMTFTEGPVWFAERNTLFFSDFFLNDPSAGRILRHTPGGGCDELIADAGTNGLAIFPDGNLLGARHSDRTLTVFDLDTLEPSVLVAGNAGAAFNSPNDIAIRSDGNLYFTDPTFLLGGRPSEQPARTYRRDPSGALSVIDETQNPNGITLSPDESLLYVSHLGNPSNVIVFDVDASGAASNPQPFINGVGSDGMAIDCAGNLYLTQNGVQVYSPDGDLIGTINAPGAANVAFGGPDRRTLFITATTTLQAIELAIPGLPY